MRRKLFLLLVSSLMVLSLVLTSCTTAEEEEEEVVEEEEEIVEEEEEVVVEEEEEYVNWWDKFGEPEYGGTLNIYTSSLNSFQPDTTQGSGTKPPIFEKLFADDWTLDRSIHNFKGAFCPYEYKQGQVAESWEMIDPLTINVYIHQGIRWHNKPPVNGREFTAEDVQYNYDRFLGTGSGFTEPSAFFSRMIAFTERAVAIDKYTVQFKFKTPNALVVFDPMTPQIEFVAPEWVEQYVGSTDWQNAVGTGPWLVTDFVAGSVMTCTRNPDYWAYDERHPENRLPYIDTYKQVAIADMTTALAALRTGKIDTIISFMGGPTWQQATSVAKTNPEIIQDTLPTEANSIDFRVDKEPFTDIRVRQALQMARDIELIAETHYGGITEGVPIGYIPPTHTGWTTPYDEWPADLQETYSYNPTRAKELLAEAGYPQGFKTNIIAGTNKDLTLLEIVKAYFLDIGVDMEIKTMDTFAAMDFTRAGKHDQMAYGSVGHQTNPWQAILIRQTGDNRNTTFNNDATFDAMIEAMNMATEMDESIRLAKEADMYAIRQQWSAVLCVAPNVMLWQPYVKGFSGERWETFYSARLWIDQDMKASMVR